MKTRKTIKVIAATALVVGACFSFYKVLNSLETESYTVVVLEKAYVPSSIVERRYIDGELYISRANERFILVVRAEDGNVSSMEVTAKQYGSATVNEPIELQRVVFKK